MGLLGMAKRLQDTSPKATDAELLTRDFTEIVDIDDLAERAEVAKSIPAPVKAQ